MGIADLLLHDIGKGQFLGNSVPQDMLGPEGAVRDYDEEFGGFVAKRALYLLPEVLPAEQLVRVAPDIETGH